MMMPATQPSDHSRRNTFRETYAVPVEEEFEEELSDEELFGGWAPWEPPWASEDSWETDNVIQRDHFKNIDLPSLSISEFVEFAFRISEGSGFVPFSFEGRRHMFQPYDSDSRRILLKTARQVEKSTLLGNRALTYSALVPGFKTLYVSPSSTQTKTFSNDRLKDPIETSDVLKSFTTRSLTQNIFEKQFINRSKITLRYAFLNADRTRGIPAWMLLLDEFQDILHDNVPVIEQCTAHAPPEWKQFCYAGTPKSLDNNLEVYWSQRSTQGEWVVPCDSCGSSIGAGRYWNVLGEKNIGLKGLICEKCGKRIHAMHDDSQWAWMVEKAQYEGYRIPQLMVPWKPWDEILLDYKNYPRNQFYNEVLGISFDSGLRPLSLPQVREQCNEKMSMHPSQLKHYRSLGFSQPIFAGIDWGCHDEETRILTEGGFKYFRDLVPKDRVAQWDPDTREMTFVVPSRRTVKKWNRPLLHFNTRGGLDLLVTDTHRMRVGASQGQRWVTETAGEFSTRGGNAKFVGYVTWTGAEVASFVLSGYPVSSGYSGSEAALFKMDDWLELLGYLISEGGLCFNNGRPSCLKMSQRKTVNFETYQKIQNCLDRMNINVTAFPNEKTGDVNWTIYGKQFWGWYATHVGLTGSTKRIPREFLKLSQRQLQILWQALVDGDGHTDTRPNCTGGTYSSTSKGLCEDFQELCIKLGLRAVLRLHKEANSNKKTQWRVSWSEGRDYQLNTPATAVKHVPYEGNVYCCTVPTGYIVTERNGCISYQGNSGENTYTVLVLGTYIEQRFRIFYAHRFTGVELDPELQLSIIIKICEDFNVTLIGTDYGGGYDRNDKLMRKFGPARLQKYQYLARSKKKVEWNPRLNRWHVHRTELMSDLFNSIKRSQLEFPCWAEWKDPFAQDICNIFTEYNETLRMTMYAKSPDRTDDTFHAILYCLLASMIKFPRPDIIAPRREDANHRGGIRASYEGPLDQG